jgi:bifunctional non-homologous end joining protein LigD
VVKKKTHGNNHGRCAICGYEIAWALFTSQLSTGMPKAKSKSAARPTTVQFVEPMYAQLVQQLPDSKEWLYEVKFDGYRCLAAKDAAGATLWSRRGNDFTPQFPNITKACEQIPARTLLDGEIVAIDENGRISFNLLQC